MVEVILPRASTTVDPSQIAQAVADYEEANPLQGSEVISALGYDPISPTELDAALGDVVTESDLTGYERTANKNANSGYAGLTATGTITASAQRYQSKTTVTATSPVAAPFPLAHGQDLGFDTRLGAFAAALPSSPSTAQTAQAFNRLTIQWSDLYGTFGTNPLTIQRGGFPINGMALDFVCDVPFGRYTAFWVGDSIGWQIIQTKTSGEYINSPSDFTSVQAAADASWYEPFFVPGNSTVVVPCLDGDIQDALNKIALWLIPESSLVDIQVAAGLFNLSQNVTVEGASSQSIKISDAGEDTLTLSSFGAITGTTGAYDVTLNLGDATLAVVGKTLAITNATGTGSFEALNGLFRITGKTGNQITIRVPFPLAGFTASLTTATLRAARTVLDFSTTSNNVAFIYRGQNGDGSGLAVNMDLHAIMGAGPSTGSAHFVDSGAKVSLAQRAGSNGFEFGIRTVSGGHITAVGTIWTNLAQPIYALSNSYIQIVNGWVTNFTGTGMSAVYNSTIAGSGAIIAGGSRGVQANYESSIAMAGCILRDFSIEAILAQDGYVLATSCSVLRYGESAAIGGIRSVRGGFIDFGSSTANTAVTGNDLRAEFGGVIRAVSATYARVSPAVNVRSNSGGLIYTSDTPTTKIPLELSTGASIFTGVREGSVVANVASIPAGGTATVTIPVTGVLSNTRHLAMLGDNVNLAGLIYSIRVSATDTVTLTLFNPTGAAIDPPNGAYRAIVWEAP